MTDSLFQVLKTTRDWVWSPPLLFLLLGVGLYLSCLLKGMQFRYVGYAIRQVFSKRDAKADGDISHFQALMTALAGAIGTGSIVGVATGVAIGGMGALFWMWVTALVGMATKFSESLLACKYRVTDEKGEKVGGPMEYLERGLGWRSLAIAFSLMGCIAALGTGNLVQVNSIGDALSDVWGVNPWVTGVVLCGVTSLVLLGGVQSIARVAGVLVPTMATFYVVGGLSIILLNIQLIPAVFSQIFREAFSGSAAAGGAAGSAMIIAIQTGVARSVFSNEAGLGVASIADAAAKTDHPGRQAMVAMTGALLSTIVVCTITGLVIGITGALQQSNGMEGATLAIRAFSSGIPGGQYIVSTGLIMFAYTTVLAWAFYGEKCCEYLFGLKAVVPYRMLYCLIVIPGAAVDLRIAWSIADIANGLMAIPNLIGLAALSKVIRSETSDFLRIVDRELKEEGG